ncbi:MAG: hypothetical protein HOO90_01020 [Methylotenera sp.]|uniref:hypothetical protein n=1 Tax=Methylotenera sp. TaxID=2051956 RepID=UPI00181DF709|nr:hypothetical protein [Methylotenera sp.]NOU24097.1 hypothetical protein [Methylotenera sp.]
MTFQSIFDDHPITTYSNLLEWLISIPMRVAPSAQWIATIKAAKGIRTEEIERSELLDYLFEYTDDQKVTKEHLLEIAEYGLSTCRITVQTERSSTYRPTLQCKSFPPENIPKKVSSSFADGSIIGCMKLPSFAYKVIGLRYTDLFGGGEGWYIFDERWRQIKPYRCYKNSLDSIDAVYSAIVNKFSRFTSHVSFNHYEWYALLGKRKNYKEWIVSIPSWVATFESTHFVVENTVLHLRTSEWKDSDGLPLLLIDEIQSDWHATGRVNGYSDIDELLDNDESDAVPDAPFIKEWHELGIKIAIWVALKSGHSRIAFTKGDVHSERYGEDLEGFHLLYDQAIPKSLAKLVSKFQCHLGSAIITISKPNQSIRHRSGTGWELLASGKNEKSKVVKNEVVAMRYLVSRGQKKQEEVRMFEISPALADAVKSKGIPLFGWW